MAEIIDVIGHLTFLLYSLTVSLYQNHSCRLVKHTAVWIRAVRHIAHIILKETEKFWIFENQVEILFKTSITCLIYTIFWANSRASEIFTKFSTRVRNMFWVFKTFSQIRGIQRILNQSRATHTASSNLKRGKIVEKMFRYFWKFSFIGWKNSYGTIFLQSFMWKNWKNHKIQFLVTKSGHNAKAISLLKTLDVNYIWITHLFFESIRFGMIYR